jgi:nicotinamide-nucleotide adenylyltransferase
LLLKYQIAKVESRQLEIPSHFNHLNRSPTDLHESRDLVSCFVVSPMSSRTYSTHFQSFVASSETFKILNPPDRPLKDEPLYILDSSFNPPTNAHFALSLVPLSQNPNSTVLLLLAIQNADKAPKPASFDHRLEMMDLLAKRIESTSSMKAVIALSKHPIFVDKAKDIDIAFPSTNHVFWLVGYDTLIRILDQKYYSDTLEQSLGLFWKRNRIICAIRGDESVEREFLKRVLDGLVLGVPGSWAEYITLIAPVGKDDSSTRARRAASQRQWEEVGAVVPQEINDYIQKEDLYREGQC